jgi:guanine deaminase
MDIDKIFLTRAVEIAMAGINEGCGPFGAVITLNGKIISETVNRVVLLSDPTAHAEVLAIRAAAAELKSHDLSSCTLYTSCEPCPMCLGAIYWAGIEKVVYCYDRSDAANAGFNDKMIYDELALIPSERRIRFSHIDLPGVGDVFRAWEKSEKKIPY